MKFNGFNKKGIEFLQELKNKGYNLPEQKFKRIPQGFNKDYKNIYLYLYGAMYAYKSFKIDNIFFKIELLDSVFEIYNDMKYLQKWVYEMTLTLKE